jgi:hypothetical protein
MGQDYRSWPTPRHRRRKPLGRCPRKGCNGALRMTSKPPVAICVTCGHDTKIEES